MSFEIAGRYAYVADRYSGVHVVDIADPAQASVVRILEEAAVAHICRIESGVLYVMDQRDDVWAYDMSRPDSPQAYTNCVTGEDQINTAMAVHDRIAYVAVRDEGLKMVDFSDPANPSMSAPPNTITNATDLEVVGPYLYALNTDSRGLSILNASTLQPVTNLAWITNGVDIEPAGTNLFIAITTNSSIIRLDVTDPASPGTLAVIPMPDLHVKSLSVSGNLLYALSFDYYAGYPRMSAFRLDDPGYNEEHVYLFDDHYYTTDDGFRMARVSADYIYTVNTSKGLMIFGN